MGRGAWGAPVHELTNGGTRLSSEAQRTNVIDARATRAAQLVDPACRAGDPGSIPGREGPLEKGKAAHSSILGFPWWLRW